MDSDSDGDVPYGNEDGENEEEVVGGVDELLHLSSALGSIPDEFRKSPFQALPCVIKILQAITRDFERDGGMDESPDEHPAVKELEDHFDTMEAAMNLIVDGMLVYVYYI